jgi:hypothetical protein
MRLETSGILVVDVERRKERATRPERGTEKNFFFSVASLLLPFVGKGCQAFFLKFWFSICQSVFPIFSGGIPYYIFLLEALTVVGCSFNLAALN